MVLLKLINNPDIPYDTLVVEFNISRRTVSRVFESLVKKWYIQRVGENKKKILGSHKITKNDKNALLNCFI